MRCRQHPRTLRGLFSSVLRGQEASDRPHPQVMIPARGGNYLVLTKVDADLAPSAEQSTAQGQWCAAHLHPSVVAAGHEPLTMDRRPSAVLSHVFAGRPTP